MSKGFEQHLRSELSTRCPAHRCRASKTSHGGRTNQRLCGELTYDGGHLNTLGRRQVALGFYAVCHALLGADRDGDGATDGEELIAGTRPDAAGSVFGFGGAATSGAGGGFVVSWPGTAVIASIRGWLTV